MYNILLLYIYEYDNENFAVIQDSLGKHRIKRLYIY